MVKAVVWRSGCYSRSMSSTMPQQVLPTPRPAAGSFRERFLGMFQASSPLPAPAAPAAPLSEAEKLAALLTRATAGDAQPAKSAVLSLVNKSAGPWDLKVLEQILNGAPASMEKADLQAIVDSRDPTQKVSSAGMENLHIDGTWDAYRTLDCSHLRKLAKQELSRRQETPGTAT
jgi:hypothetical protein